jgi:hypothetical protein
MLELSTKILQRSENGDSGGIAAKMPFAGGIPHSFIHHFHRQSTSPSTLEPITD